MDIIKIKNTVIKLIKKYDTNNPFEICDYLDIKVFFQPLHGNGLFIQKKRIKMIFIDQDLSDQGKKQVCAHELGHAIMHSKVNAVFLDTNSHQIIGTYENEANLFAAELLISEDEILDNKHLTNSQLSSFLGVDEKLVKYKANNIKAKHK